EPTTSTRAILAPGPPRKLIWLCGEASSVPGSGDTVTGLTATTAFADAALGGGAGVGEAPPQPCAATAASSGARKPRRRSLLSSDTRASCQRRAAVGRSSGRTRALGGAHEGANRPRERASLVAHDRGVAGGGLDRSR